MSHTPADREPPDLPVASGVDPEHRPAARRRAEARSSRRTFIRQGLLAGGALLLGAGAGGTQAKRAPKRAAHRHRRAMGRRAPNILVVLVDQLRTPVWLPAGVAHAQIMPTLAALRRGAVNFESHYVASNDCSPSRGTLLTGLYSHQTGCLITGNSLLDPGFPTWGTLLRERGYETNWWGKWHLNPNPDASLQQYGFGGGTYPSPNGAPGQGMEVDGAIAAQFAEWFAQEGGAQPWCSTVSFVNPHDIAWWYRFTSKIPQEATPPAWARALPANFETPEAHEAQRKPRLQRSLQETAEHSFGRVEFEGPEAVEQWSGLMNTYLLLQSLVDAQIRTVLDALASRPEIQANTVVVFTSDHGEYGGSHGMRGKGASAYEEAIRVPLSVRDFRPRGQNATAASAIPRSQLTSSVDVIAMLLTLATGSDAWRREPHYAHLASRHDLAAILAHPSAPGREWVLHATDEDVTEFASEPYSAEAPRHVVALRSARGKLAIYYDWRSESIEIEPAGQEYELYDYSEPAGRAELVNRAGQGDRLEEQLWTVLETRALPGELREPLPARLRAAQRRGLENYAGVEEFENLKVYATRQNRAPSPEPAPETQVAETQTT